MTKLIQVLQADSLSEMLDAHQHYNNRLLNSLNTWQTKEPNKEALHSEAIFSSERHGEKFKQLKRSFIFG